MRVEKVRLLTRIDKKLRELFPVKMTNGVEVQVKIEKICGFELFNNVAYHNYETWSDGYRITAGDITVEAEDLDDAVHKLDVEMSRQQALKKVNNEA